MTFGSTGHHRALTPQIAFLVGPCLSPQTTNPKMVETFPGVVPRPNWELPSGPGGLRGLRVLRGTLAERHHGVVRHFPLRSSQVWGLGSSLLGPRGPGHSRCSSGPQVQARSSLPQCCWSVVCLGSSRLREEGFVAVRAFVLFAKLV